MPQINRLIVKFDRNIIDDKFDFYLLKTSEKFIKHGAYILDKPLQKLKVRSLVFENGRSAFFMLEKNKLNINELRDVLEDETISIGRIYSHDIKDYILFRLFLYSLTNFETEFVSYNNLTGKFYVFHPNWIKFNKKNFKCLQIDIDSDMCIKADACSFNSLDKFKDKKIKSKEFPKYTFEGNNRTLKRVFNYDKESDVYVKRATFNTKCEIPFFSLKKDDIALTKVNCIYHVIKLMREKYGDYINIQFDNIVKTDSIRNYKDENVMSVAIKLVNEIGINVVNWSSEKIHNEEFEKTVEYLSTKISNFQYSDKLDFGKCNLVLIHNKEYYKENEIEDPHKIKYDNVVVQYFTIEDSLEKLSKQNESIANTIIKEMAIKMDIIFNKKISLDDWTSLNFNEDLIIGKENSENTYFITIKPNGTIDFDYRIDSFKPYKNNVLNELVEEFSYSNYKEKILIKMGKNRIMLSRSNMFPMPNEEIFSLKTISRSKESRDFYLDGVVDINHYIKENELFFNTGIKGSGMNTAIPKAPLLYRIEVIEGENIFDRLLQLLSVTFVKYKQFTVLPYPVKYLNEFIELVRVDNDK